MLNPYDSERNRDDAFARWQRRQRIVTWLARAIWVVWVAWFICWMQADIAESDAVIEACKGNQTFECMRKAREDYRQGR